ncbi:MAG: hypothetical protein RLZZ319_601 [Actinomycetota bacterium]|jgi:uncharacterized Tic20 family protein
MAQTADTANSRQTAALAHILGIVTGFVAPLIIFIVKKDDSFVRDHAREALNFQITVGALYFANNVLGWIAPLWFLFSWIAVLGLIAVTIAWAVLGFQAANAGRTYRYPVAVRLVS